MPFTAFHPVPVWLLWMKFPQRLDFVALTVGAIIPDLLEPLTIVGLSDTYPTQREWSHSLLGALTYDAVLAVGATILVARPFLRWADRVQPSGLWRRFAGHDFQRPSPWSVTLVSAWIGSVSHALVDLPFHDTSTLFSPAPILHVFPVESNVFASIIVNLIFGPAFVYVLYMHWWRPSRRPPLTRGSRKQPD